MTLIRMDERRWCRVGPRAVLGLAVLLLVVGCGPTEEPAMSVPSDTSPRAAATAQALETGNGLSVNGLSFNGLSFNGLSFNGLSFNGLSTDAFASWFRMDPELANKVMRYLVHCAVRAGEVRTYTAEGRTFGWAGGLGLAPAWAGGAPATVLEQQVVSACLAAHANKYNQQVPISVLGRRADGLAIPVADEELRQYTWRESCFFGNLFSGEGVYVGRDKARLKPRESSSRACSVVASRGHKEDKAAEALDDGESSSEQDPPEEIELNRRRCAPLIYIGQCARHCVMDASKLFYASCTWNGVTYSPLTTRMDKRNLYKCGDGVCQPTESCGARNDFLSCKADCGSCG